MASTSTKSSPALEKRGRGRPRGSLGKKPRVKIPPAQLGYRIAEFAEAVRLSRSAILRAIGNGEIKTVKIGHSLLIPISEVKRLGFVTEA